MVELDVRVISHLVESTVNPHIHFCGVEYDPRNSGDCSISSTFTSYSYLKDKRIFSNLNKYVRSLEFQLRQYSDYSPVSVGDNHSFFERRLVCIAIIEYGV